MDLKVKKVSFRSLIKASLFDNSKLHQVALLINDNSYIVNFTLNTFKINKDVYFQVFIDKSYKEKKVSINFDFHKQTIEYLFDNLNEGIIIHRNGIIVSLNWTAKRILGFDREEFLDGLNLFEVIHPDFRSAAAIRMKALNSGLNVPTFTYKLYKKSKKELIDVDVKSFPLHDFNDNLVLMVVNNHSIDREIERIQDVEFVNKLLQNEIIDRIQIQNQLQQTQHYLNGIINSSLDIIIASDKDSRITEFNSAAQKTFGYNREEVIGKPVKILYASKTAYNRVQSSLRKNGVFSDEITNIKKDGTLFTSYLNLSEMTDDMNNSIGRVGVSRDITHFKAQQEALISSELRYRKLFENTSDLLFSFLTDGTLVYYNRSFSELLGYSEKELDDIGLLHLIHPNNISGFINQLHSDNTKKVFSTELTLLKKSKKYLIIEGDINKIFSESNEIISFVCSFRDVSAVKIAEEAIRLSDERYRAVFNQDFMGVLITGLFGEIIQYNPKLESMLGIEELRNSKLENLLGSFGSEAFNQANRLLLEGETKSYRIATLTHKDSKLVYNESIELVKDNFGNPNFFLFIYEDVTDKKFAEEKLIKQSTKLNSLLQSSSLIIFTIDKDLKLTSFNEQFKVYLVKFLKIEPYLGYNIYELKPFFKNSADFEDLITVHKNALNGKKQYFEKAFHLNTGEEIWFESYIDPLLLPGGIIEEISFVNTNITEKKSTHKRISQSLIEKEILLKEVHHRVKNNLQVISSILNLQSSYLKDSSVIEVIRDIQNRIKSMALIHENLYQNVDLSKLNFGEYINQLTQNIVHSNQSYYGNIEIISNIKEIYLDLDYSIPCGLIINELVTNAFKHAFPRGTKGVVTINISTKSNVVTIIIEDTGVGFKKGIDFRNTESLGLQLVTALTEQINGNISLTSGKGSTKYIITFNYK